MKLEPNYLKVEELDYELALRGIDSASKTVDAKRKLLRGALAQADHDRSSVELRNEYDFAVDSKATIVTIEDLEKVINAFSHKSDESKRIHTRLAHLANRIARLNAVEDADFVEVKRLNECMLLLECDFSWKVKSFEPASASTPTRSSAPPANVNTSHSFQPVYKWNISFPGKNNISLFSFLETVEHLRVSRGLTKQELFNSAADLFNSDVQIWYYRNVSRVSSWDELVALLKEHFLPQSSDAEVWAEISSKSQGPNDNVSVFIACVANLFDRLSTKPPEPTIVSHIRKRLLPFFISQTALSDLKSIYELDATCTKLEESRVYIEQSTQNKQSSNSRNSNLCCMSCQHEENVNVASLDTQNKIICWNCKKAGHRHQQCNQRRNLFCYGCGRPGVISTKCETCSKNASGGVRKSNANQSSQAGPSGSKQ
jgi:hypothetical protein